MADIITVALALGALPATLLALRLRRHAPAPEEYEWCLTMSRRSPTDS